MRGKSFALRLIRDLEDVRQGCLLQDFLESLFVQTRICFGIHGRNGVTRLLSRLEYFLAVTHLLEKFEVLAHECSVAPHSNFNVCRS